MLVLTTFYNLDAGITFAEKFTILQYLQISHVYIFYIFVPGYRFDLFTTSLQYIHCRKSLVSTRACNKNIYFQRQESGPYIYMQFQQLLMIYH
jgi:hypothetical protein